MFVDYELPNAKKWFIPQSSGLTCWAACAAGIKSAQAKKMVMEKSFLTGKYLDAFNARNPTDPDNPGRDLLPAELNDLYNNVLSFSTHSLDVGSRDKLATFVHAKEPIIVMSSIVDFQSGTPVHKGYHVRLVYGVRGETVSENDDDLEVRIFDPYPPQGYQAHQPFKFKLFKYQMELKTGPVSTMVGQCWYA